MYNITSEVLAKFLNCEKQGANITVSPTDSDPFTLTEADIQQGGLVIDRAVATGDVFTAGSCIASELTLKVLNPDGALSNITWEGAEINVSITVGTYSVPMGYFTVDSAPKKRDVLEISALDRMAQFGKEVGDISSWFSVATNLATIVSNICTACNVPLATNLSGKFNSTYIPQEPSYDGLTYWQLLMWCLELMGQCGYINEQGQLVVTWPEEIPTAVWGNTFILYPDYRFESEVSDLDVEITGIKYGSDTVGSDGYVLDFSENQLAKDISAFTGSPVIGFSYTPFSATTVPLPHLFPTDRLYYTTTNKASVSAIAGIAVVGSAVVGIVGTRPLLLTNWTYTLNAKCDIQGVGESLTETGYSLADPNTLREQAIISQLKAEISSEINTRVSEVSRFNELIANSLGLWWTSETQTDGSVKIFMHDAPTLSASTNVFTMNNGAFAWTDDYQGTSTVWQTAIDFAGNAMFRFISAIGLSLADANNQYHTEILPDSFSIYQGTALVMKIYAGASGTSETQMAIPKIVIDDPSTADVDGYIQIGKCRLIPTSTGMNIVNMD